MDGWFSRLAQRLGVPAWMLLVGGALYWLLGFFGNLQFLNNTALPWLANPPQWLAPLILFGGFGLLLAQRIAVPLLTIEFEPDVPFLRVDYPSGSTAVRRAAVGVRNNGNTTVRARLSLERAEPRNGFTPVPLSVRDDVADADWHGRRPEVPIRAHDLVLFDVAVKADDLDTSSQAEFRLRYARPDYNRLARGRHLLYLRPIGAGHNDLSTFLLDLDAQGRLTFARAARRYPPVLVALLPGVTIALTLGLMVLASKVARVGWQQGYSDRAVQYSEADTSSSIPTATTTSPPLTATTETTTATTTPTQVSTSLTPLLERLYCSVFLGHQPIHNEGVLGGAFNDCCRGRAGKKNVECIVRGHRYSLTCNSNDGSCPE
jgi:hypothetical protein